MKVKIFNSVNDCDEFELQITCVREILSGLTLYKGKEYAENIIKNKYKYILIPKDEKEEPVALIPEVVLSDISKYEILLIVPDVLGEIPAVAVAGVLASAGITVGATALTIITAIVNIALSMALNMVMSLLSPTKEFSSDPAQAQHNNSNLFNGAPLIREQGGSVPLAYGYGFAGGVLISSSLTTVEG